MRHAQRTGLDGLAVLVVDDSRSMRELLSEMLYGLGVGVVSQAENGEEALQKLELAKPDILFADWSMPTLDGIGFVRAIRADRNSALRHVPIVMITGHAERERVTEARDAGINEFLAKPISGRALAARLETLIHRPRPFVRTASYYGPDRRRKAEAHEGEERRARQAAMAASQTLTADDIQLLLAK